MRRHTRDQEFGWEAFFLGHTRGWYWVRSAVLPVGIDMNLAFFHDGVGIQGDKGQIPGQVHPTTWTTVQTRIEVRLHTASHLQ